MELKEGHAESKTATARIVNGKNGRRPHDLSNHGSKLITYFRCGKRGYFRWAIDETNQKAER